MGNKLATSKHIFGMVEDFNSPCNEQYLVCPRCGEHLKQTDIEKFFRCPFCDSALPDDIELEDFILKPVADNWACQQGAVPSVIRDDSQQTD